MTPATPITAEIHDVIHPNGKRVYVAVLGDRLGRPVAVGHTFKSLTEAEAWVARQEERLDVQLALRVNVRP